MKRFFIGRTQALHIQFLRYFFVGGSATVVDIFVFTLCVQSLQMHYLLAALMGYMVGLVWNHILSILWVFESKRHKLIEFFLVFVVALGGLLWTELLMYLSVDALGISPFVAKLIVVWLVLLWNFGMRRYYVFR
ncbi:MAG: GtrA family protein [Candidatus Peribacteraceae bacterium]|jgi:putative flippase GtrA